MKILVTGQHGQLAQALCALNCEDDQITCLGRPSIDICNLNSISQILTIYKPDLVVNTAAFTAVDQAESKIEEAFLINHQGAKNVARATARINIPIIHLSTDYVFKGNNQNPYKEEDMTEPLNIYGLSKLKGEVAVAKENSQHVILRTAWLYSFYGNNFLTTMLKFAETKKEINVINDQWGTPTHSTFVAQSIIKISRQIFDKNFDKNKFGLYHLVADGYATWFEFAKTIFENYLYENNQPIINPIKSNQLQRQARRPQFSMLDNTKIKKNFALKINPWQTYL